MSTPAANLKINSGEKIALLGKSGSGKTTLISVLNGTIKPTHGEVKLFNKSFEELDRKQKSKITTIWQDIRLIEDLTAEQNVNCGLLAEKNIYFAFKNLLNISSFNKAHKYMQLCRLHKSIYDKKIRKLSGGQKQRVAIGRAITRSPKVFLFDEPLSNLDAALRSEMRVEISKLHKKINSNMIYVTHDQVEAMTLADRIVVLNKGIIEQFGTPNDIYTNPNNIFVAEFIGSPKMNILKVEKEQIINSNTLNLFNNNINFSNHIFKDEIYLGIRPEDISLRDNHEIKLEVKIEHTENLGFEKIIHTKISDNEIVIKSSENVNKHSLKISFSKDKVLFFDKSKNRMR